MGQGRSNQMDSGDFKTEVACSRGVWACDWMAAWEIQSATVPFISNFLSVMLKEGGKPPAAAV